MDPSSNTTTYLPSHASYDHRPNPFQPGAATENNSLNGTTKEPTKSNLRLLLDDDVGGIIPRPTKRRKSGEVTTSLELPGLPLRKHGAQRLRIPPTLSGLHQPPPDAGLLPSMSMEQPVRLLERTEATELSLEETPPLERETSARKQIGSKVNRKHKKWSQSETEDLLKGVARFGIGKWTIILKCPDFHFDNRTALDLKDRFRVCRPNDYREGRSVGSSKTADSTPLEVGESCSKGSEATMRSSKQNRVSIAQLEKLGIARPFERSKRRQRTEWDAKEDEALLVGFKVHNSSWASIRDSTPALRSRTTTDLRDRLRTRFPEEYAKAGLTPRNSASFRKAKQDEADAGETSNAAATKDTNAVPPPLRSNDNTTRKESSQLMQGPAKKQPQPTSILDASDVFWGAPYETEGSESAEPITLDRRILDWPYDQRRVDGSGKGASIDPLATLNLPLPTAKSANGGAATGILAAQQTFTIPSANLPSVATITALSDGETSSEHLELPSLVGAFGSLETDGRSGGHFMSMDELLS